MGDLVPKKQLVSYGSKGVGGVIGGAAILALGALGAIPSLIVGGIIGLVGLGVSRSADDRKAGLVMAAAGAAVAITAIPGIGPLAGWLLGVSGIGLLALGGWNLFKFIRGYKKRM